MNKFCIFSDDLPEPVLQFEAPKKIGRQNSVSKGELVNEEAIVAVDIASSAGGSGCIQLYCKI